VSLARNTKAIIAAPWTTEEGELGYDFTHDAAWYVQLKAPHYHNAGAPAYRFTLARAQYITLCSLANRVGVDSVWYALPCSADKGELRVLQLLIDGTVCVRPTDISWPAGQSSATLTISMAVTTPVATIGGRNVPGPLPTCRDLFCAGEATPPRVRPSAFWDSIEPALSAAADAVGPPPPGRRGRRRDPEIEEEHGVAFAAWNRRRVEARAAAFYVLTESSFAVIPQAIDPP
jgi:hypothetical protein